MPVLYTNAKGRTLGPTDRFTDLLVGDGGAVLALNAEALSHPLAATATRRDLGGRTVLPGPIDAHVHLLWHAQNDLYQADLVGASTLDDLLGRLSEHARRIPDGWVRGHGFDQEIMPGRTFPTRQDLDRVSRDRPIFISRICGHAVVANTRALELTGIASDDGILYEDRMDPLYEAIPEPSVDDWVEIARRGMDLAARAGFTSCHVLVGSAAEIAALQRLEHRGELKTRVRIQAPYRLLEHLRAFGLSTGFGNDWLSLGCIKMFSDGAMGPSTAALTEDYADGPGNKGEFIHPQETLERMCRETHEAGCQLAIHAIGDAAMDASMDVITLAAGSDTRAARHRIEHASVVRPDQVRRLAETGIVCCVQPQFTVTDFWTVRRLGESRKPWIYPFATMLKEGVLMSGGTDCPVEHLDPLEAIGRAVTRDDPERGNGIGEGYLESERLTVDQAWRLFTTGGAYSGFQECSLGTLEPGMKADFLALDEDPYECDPRAIETMKPAITVVGGEIVYQE